jgi:hypothetical protein
MHAALPHVFAKTGQRIHAFADNRLGNERAPAYLPLQESLTDEGADGLPDRHAAHIELFGEFSI